MEELHEYTVSCDLLKHMLSGMIGEVDEVLRGIIDPAISCNSMI